jgi:N-acetyl-gamma-glutamyl-phosphate reductase
VANPGCYASAFILLTRPLIDANILRSDAPVSIHAVSGYSGGGRSLIEKWEDAQHGLGELPYEAPYALDARHKHIPEMVCYSQLQYEPQFIPAVGPFRCGMRVEVPLHVSLLPQGMTGETIWEVFQERYHNEPFVNVMPRLSTIEERSLNPQVCNDTNRLEIHVLPHPSGHILLVATLDNLGKGACGVAIQSLNLMLGLPETTGLPV